MWLNLMQQHVMISPQCSMLAKHLDGQLAGGKIEQQNCIHSICSYDTAEFSAPRHQSDLQKVMKSARFEKGGRGANSQLFTGILCFKTNFT